MRLDDFYQGAIGIILAILMPITIIWPKLREKYNLSFGLHIFGALVFIWLIYRIPEHIRTFIFITPVVAMWMIDRALFMFLYRKSYSPVVDIKNLDKDYSVVCLPKSAAPNFIGDQYFLSCPQRFGFFDFSHPFTGFVTYKDVDSEDSFPENLPEEETTDKKGKQMLCFLVKHYPDPSFTNWFVHSHDADVQIRGPYRRVYSRLQMQPICRPIILIATGTGVGYILDFARYIQENHVELLHKVFILYSTNSPDLLKKLVCFLTKQ